MTKEEAAEDINEMYAVQGALGVNNFIQNIERYQSVKDRISQFQTLL